MRLLELLLYCYHGIGPIQCFVRACSREIAATKKPKAKSKKVRMVLRLFIETGSRFSVQKKIDSYRAHEFYCSHNKFCDRMVSENHFSEDIIPINYQLTSHAPCLVHDFTRCVKAVL